ncbi:MAG TPA: hypothetical protein PLG59_17270 [bacterium]|nr:hypothetical protein [bacterium]
MSGNDSTNAQGLPAFRRSDVLLALGLAAICTAVLWMLVPPADRCSVSAYREMAFSPLTLRAYPYGRRLLTPFLVFLLPFDIDTGFRIVTTSALYLCGAALFFLLRSWGVSQRLSGIGLILFYSSQTLEFCFANYWFVDPLAFLAYILFFFGLRYRLNALVCASLLLGTLNREQGLFLIPVAAVALVDFPFRIRRLLPFVACIAPAVIAALLIEFCWPRIADVGIGYTHSAIMSDNIRETLRLYQERGFAIFLDQEILRWLFAQLLPWAVLGITGLGRRDLSIVVVHVVLVLLPMTVTVDVHRLVFYAFPVILPLVCRGLQFVEDRVSFSRYWISAVVASLYLRSPLALWPLVFSVAAVLWILIYERKTDQKKPSVK